jgi:hypothetical protein
VDVRHAPKSDLEIEQAIFNAHFKRRAATKAEMGAWQNRVHTYEHAGLPRWIRARDQPWSTVAGIESENVFSQLKDTLYTDARGYFDHAEPFAKPSARTLHDWAVEYCRSKRLLKEFRFRKEVHGWARSTLKAEIETQLQLHKPYRCSDVAMTMEIRSQDIIVRSWGPLWLFFNNGWMLFFSWITLLYPFFFVPLRYLFLSAKWQVAGTTFAFLKWVHLEQSYPGETVEAYAERTTADDRDDRAMGSLKTHISLKATPKGVFRLVGMRSADFLSEWLPEIGARAAKEFRSEQPLIITTVKTAPPPPLQTFQLQNALRKTSSGPIVDPASTSV